MQKTVFMALVALVLASCQTTAKQVECVNDLKTRVSAGSHCLSMSLYGESADQNILVVFVHGDNNAYQWTSTAAATGGKGIVSVALVRPGYCGESGCSSGKLPNYKRSYNASIVEAVAEAVRSLTAHFKAARVIVVGRSGGSAILGAAIGKHAPLADAAILTACPCDVFTWKGGRWTGSLSPSSYTDDVPKSMSVTAITGSQDTYLSPDLAKDYIADLQSEGVSDSKFILVGAGHGVDHTQEFKDTLSDLLRRFGANS